MHITSDDVIVMFHDTTLDRTTDGKGKIADRPYYGENGVEHVRTIREPVQQIPTFEQLCMLLRKPENQHVKLNVDIKPNNDPERLFRLMKETLSKIPDFETQLAPRLILGLWHPKFIEPAKRYVPSLRRAHIGASPGGAQQFFWNDCDAFSMYFPSLVGYEGQQLLERARRDGKDVMVWTVNRRDEMIEATRWGVKAILTDRTADLQSLRHEMASDFAKARGDSVSPLFSWATWRYYTPIAWLYQSYARAQIEHSAGAPFETVPAAPPAATAA